MSEQNDFWVGAVGAWVLLSELFETIERELSVARPIAAKALRPKFENLSIHAEVLGLSMGDDDRFNRAEWTFYAHYAEKPRVARKGWLRVGRDGSLEGYAIRVRWAHIVQALAGQPQSAPGARAVASSIREETQLTDWLTERMRAAAELPRPQAQIKDDARAAGLKCSDRAFRRAWAAAVQHSQALKWSAPGRRGKSVQSNRTTK